MDFTKRFQARLDKFKTQETSIWDDLLKSPINQNGRFKRKVIKDLVIEGVIFKDSNFSDCEFYNCTFTECRFENYDFRNCWFSKCIIQKCRFKDSFFTDSFFEGVTISKSSFIDSILDQSGLHNTLFTNTTLSNFNFDATELDNCRFVNCKEIADCTFYSATFEETIIEECNLSDSSFKGRIVTESKKPALKIINSQLTDCLFKKFDFEKVTFADCAFETCIFAYSTIGTETFKGNNRSINSSFSVIDLFTIKKSKKIRFLVLKEIFGIYSPESKEQIDDITTEVKFKSIFISYSLKDEAFALKLCDKLNKKGHPTFIWTKHAPPGKRLKTIMTEYINMYDKILFISSKNSLKSEACHFELNEARKRYEKDWEDVTFPIHLDNFLFEMNEFDIPRKYRDQYWQNILDLREINSMDFSKFTSGEYTEEEFDELVLRLIKSTGLKRIKE